MYTCAGVVAVGHTAEHVRVSESPILGLGINLCAHHILEACDIDIYIYMQDTSMNSEGKTVR